MVPLIQQEAVEVHHWYTDAEFADLLGMGTALPGPIATKLSAAVGYRVAGLSGAAVATVATVLPSVIMLLVLIAVFARFKDNPTVAAMMKGVRPTVVALMIVVAWDLRRGSFAGWGSYVLFAGCLAVGLFTSIHPAIPIVVGAAIGALFFR